MLPDRVSNPGPLPYESGALPIALRGPARLGGLSLPRKSRVTRPDWLVGWFWVYGPLRQYFSLYRAVSQREGERGKKG